MFEHIQFGTQQEQLLHGLGFELEEEDGPTFPKGRRQHTRPTQQDYSNCAWQTLYLDNPDVRNAASDVGKLFRCGFRVPYPIFEHLCDIDVTLGSLWTGSAATTFQSCINPQTLFGFV